MDAKKIMMKETPTVDDMREALRKMLAFIGEDPDREGLLETPDRIIKSWGELYAGYKQSPEEILSKTFSESEGYDQIILLRNIKFTSFCEHHKLPFMGAAHVGYLAGDRVVGISKLARLVQCFAKRMQIQERMTRQIALSIMEYLKPKGCGVIITGHHLCMSARGIKSVGAEMVTSAMEGVFKDNSGGCKSEFFKMIEV